MWIVALFLFQHVILPDLPNVEKNPYTKAADIEQGKKLYAGRCAGCHGPSGDGGKGTNLATPVLPRGRSDLALYRVIRYGLPETEMPAHNMTQREIWQMAAYVRTLGKAGEGARGDIRKGEELVRSKGSCLQCHVLNGEGGHLGPSLSDIGVRRSPAYLRKKLVDPGQDLAGNFSLVNLTTRDGRKMTGVRMNEDTWSIQVRDAKLNLHSFWKKDLAELQVEQRTLMPSYAKQFDEKELTDVVAFLASTGGEQ
ncbi:MAG TPA: c-type cytochrome [Bryobacteraceae bacterium]|nr:c-type cytochrome [Bryobacteraceae bacterium]